MSVNVGTAVGYLDLDTSGFKRGFTSALADLKTFGDSSASASTRITALGSAMTSVGGSMTKYVTTPLLGVGTAAVKVTSDFQSAMAEVRAISGATGSDFAALEAIAKEMGATTKFSASEAAEGLKYMAMAGWDTQQMVDGLPGIMLLAAAAGEELGAVSDIVTDALTAFGMEANEAAHFADVLAAASNSSNTNVSMLGESFKFVAPVAGALGYSVEDVAVALGLMANSGIKAGTAGMTLRTILTNMADPTDKMAEAMDKLGVSLEDGEGNMLSLDQVMLDLRAGFGQTAMSQEELTRSVEELEAAYASGMMTEEEYEQAQYDLMEAAYGVEGAEKAKLASMLAGKQGMAGLLAIVNTTEEDFNKLTASINNADGTAQEMADVMGDTLGGQLYILKSTIEGIAISFGEIMMPAVRKVVEVVQEFASKLNDLSDEQKEQIVKIAAIVAAIGPLLLVGGKLVTGIGSMISAFGAIKGAITPLIALIKGFGAASTAAGAATAGGGAAAAGGLGAVAAAAAPVIAAIAAIAAAIAAFVVGWKENLGGFKDKILEGFESFKSAMDPVQQRIQKFVDEVKQAIAWLKQAWDSDFGGMRTIVESVFSVIGTVIQYFITLLGDVINFVTAIIFGDWAGAWEAAKDIVTHLVEAIWEILKGLLDIITNVLQSIWDIIVSIFTAIKDWAVNLWEELKNAVVEKVTSIAEGVRDGFNNAVESIKNWFNEVVTWFAELPGKVGEALMNALTSVIEWGQNVYNNMVESISSMVQSVSDFFNELPYNIGYALGFALQTTIDWLTSMWEKVSSEISRLIKAVIDWFSELPGNVKKWLDSTLQNTINWLTSMKDKVTEGITTLINNVVKWFSELPGKVKTHLDTFITNVVNWLTDMTNKVTTGITTMINNVVQWFSELPGKIKQHLDTVITRVTEWVTNMINKATEVGTKFVNTIVDWVKKLPGEFTTYMNNVINYLTGLPSRFMDLGKNIMQSFFDGIKSIGDSILGWFENLWDSVMSLLKGIKDGMNDAKDATKDSGKSHAHGLDTVPYDNYPANLHYGETVLTKQEADEYRSGKGRGGDTYVTVVSPDPMTEASAARAFINANKELALGLKV